MSPPAPHRATPATMVEDPFGGTAANWSLTDNAPPDTPWPSSDPVEMARLDAWVDQMEREYFDRCGNGDEE